MTDRDQVEKILNRALSEVLIYPPLYEATGAVCASRHARNWEQMLTHLDRAERGLTGVIETLQWLRDHVGLAQSLARQMARRKPGTTIEAIR